MNKAHFIGIAGKTMAPLAKMFKNMGWRVTGSDHGKTYPPISTYLKQNKIAYIEGYSAQNISNKPDLVVVGRSALLVNPKNPEYLQAKKLGFKIVSYPEVLRDYLVKTNSIVVAGTYGKTTISGLVAWILEKGGLNPSFMVGGVPLNFANGIRKTDSVWSVVEGDEPPALKETDPPKFMFYKPKYVLLTAVQWDHPEIFPTEKEYLRAFVQFIKLVPKDGLVVTCLEDKSVDLVVGQAKCPVVGYTTDGKTVKRADYFVKNVKFGQDYTRFTVFDKNDARKIEIKSFLLGHHNIQNVCGAVALCLKLGIAPRIIQKAVRTYGGIKTRLEFVGEFDGVKIYWDLAQHPVKVKQTLAALRTRYQKNKIICVFDPHQAMLQHPGSLKWYPGAFDQADEVMVIKMSFSKAIPKEARVTGKDIIGAIAKTQPIVFYQPLDDKAVEYLATNTNRGDIIIFMSSGGQRTPWIVQKLLKS